MEAAELPEGQPVVTVCAAGSSSAVAAEQLRDRGLEAYTLEGGMKAWSIAWNTAEVSVAGTGARLIQVRRTGKGYLSYLIGPGGEAAVIDATLTQSRLCPVRRRRLADGDVVRSLRPAEPH